MKIVIGGNGIRVLSVLKALVNTYDILELMSQYQFEFPEFMFLGVYPIDFASKDSMGNCIIDEMCSINLQKLRKKNIDSFGVVFNLDKHDEPGSHWVACYCGFNPHKKNYGRYFYDSYADGYPNEIKNFMYKIKDNLKDEKKKFIIKDNKKRHQFGHSECGMFSINFLIQLIKGNSINKVYNMDINDDEVNKLRNILYTPQKLVKKKLKIN